MTILCNRNCLLRRITASNAVIVTSMPKDKEKKKSRKSEVEDPEQARKESVTEDVEMADGTVSSPVSGAARSSTADNGVA